jgi:hypothetical protein
MDDFPQARNMILMLIKAGCQSEFEPISAILQDCEIAGANELKKMF